jgi:3-isopropylmalate/(R)-2-methylmalate dehydratase large subunit
LGALAFGIGSSELTHVLATQAIIQRRPKTMRVMFEGQLPFGVTAKDLILALIGHVGAAGGTGYAVEYAGSAIRDLPIEGRLTICNLSIELGAKMGMVAPDQKTFDYLRGRAYAPQGEMWERAVEAWRQLPSDPDAVFDREVVIDVEKSFRRSPGASAPNTSSAWMVMFPIRRRSPIRRVAPRSRPHSTIWVSRPARRLSARPSIGSSLGHAPIAG